MSYMAQRVADFGTTIFYEMTTFKIIPCLEISTMIRKMVFYMEYILILKLDMKTIKEIDGIDSHHLLPKIYHRTTLDFGRT